jgi:hypothetical protein
MKILGPLLKYFSVKLGIMMDRSTALPSDSTNDIDDLIHDAIVRLNNGNSLSVTHVDSDSRFHDIFIEVMQWRPLLQEENLTTIINSVASANDNLIYELLIVEAGKKYF